MNIVARVVAPVAGDKRLLGPANTARPTFSVTEDLEGDGVRYTLRLHWAQLLGSWLVDATRVDGLVVDRGIGLVLSMDMFAPYRRKVGTPPGQLFALTADGSSLTPRRGDLVSLVSVYYRPAAVAAAQVGLPTQLW